MGCISAKSMLTQAQNAQREANKLTQHITSLDILIDQLNIEKQRLELQRSIFFKERDAFNAEAYREIY